MKFDCITWSIPSKPPEKKKPTRIHSLVEISFYSFTILKFPSLLHMRQPVASLYVSYQFNNASMMKYDKPTRKTKWNIFQILCRRRYEISLTQDIDLSMFQALVVVVIIFFFFYLGSTSERLEWKQEGMRKKQREKKIHHYIRCSCQEAHTTQKQCARAEQRNRTKNNKK